MRKKISNAHRNSHATKSAFPDASSKHSGGSFISRLCSLISDHCTWIMTKVQDGARHLSSHSNVGNSTSEAGKDASAEELGISTASNENWNKQSSLSTGVMATCDSGEARDKVDIKHLFVRVRRVRDANGGKSKSNYWILECKLCKAKIQSHPKTMENHFGGKRSKICDEVLRMNRTNLIQKMNRGEYDKEKVLMRLLDRVKERENLEQKNKREAFRINQLQSVMNGNIGDKVDFTEESNLEEVKAKMELEMDKYRRKIERLQKSKALLDEAQSNKSQDNEARVGQAQVGSSEVGSTEVGSTEVSDAEDINVDISNPEVDSVPFGVLPSHEVEVLSVPPPLSNDFPKEYYPDVSASKPMGKTKPMGMPALTTEWDNKNVRCMPPETERASPLDSPLPRNIEPEAQSPEIQFPEQGGPTSYFNK